MAIAFVSWSSGAGVSSLCASLAQLISRSGRRTTLFKDSLDLHTKTTDPHLACPASLVDIALADFKFENFTIQEADGLVVVPIHSLDMNANLFTDFRNSRIQMILEAARLQGDVIFDLPALHETMDAMALCAYADAVVVVVAAEETTIEEVTEAVQLLRRRGANVIGTVLNKARQ
jgi:Mrp family chromosome partitioning ATPase